MKSARIRARTHYLTNANLILHFTSLEVILMPRLAGCRLARWCLVPEVRYATAFG